MKKPWYARIVAVTVAVVAVVLVPSGASAAYDPAPWTALLLPAPAGYDPDTSDTCPDGSVRCVDRTITKLGDRLEPLVAQCDHNLVFAFFYYRITQAFRAVVSDPHYFQSNAYHNQLDAVFASYYLNQRRAWAKGELAAVSPGWERRARAMCSRG